MDKPAVTLPIEYYQRTERGPYRGLSVEISCCIAQYSARAREEDAQKQEINDTTPLVRSEHLVKLRVVMVEMPEEPGI